MRKKTIEDIRQYLKENDITTAKLLSTTYENNETKLLWECACGQTFERTFNNFTHGVGKCLKCINVENISKPLYSYEDIKLKVKDKGRSTLIDDGEYVYTTKDSKLKFKCCECGVHFIRPLHNFLNGTGACDNCSRTVYGNPKKTDLNSVLQYMKDFPDIKLLSDTYEKAKAPLLWRCSCGDEFIRTFSQMKIAKHKICPRCSNRFGSDAVLLTNDQVSERLALKDLVWLNPEDGYKGHTHYLKLRCPCGNIFWSNLTNITNNYGRCEHCSKAGTSKPEEDLVAFIMTKYNGVIEHRYKLPSSKELDIYIPELKLAVEYNGMYWHSELAGKSKHYHLDKTKECAELDIRLIHIFEDQWLNKQEITKSLISSALGVYSSKHYARNLSIRNVNTECCRDFLNKNHIQGFVGSSHNIGLYANEDLVAIMTFGKSRYTKTDFELIRYASKLNTIVVGGASKLFKNFIKYNKSKSIVSYSDKSLFSGSIYETLGFIKSHDSAPNYYYFKRQKVYSRVAYQKHKLEGKLEKFNKNKTEWENMKENGFNRYWDCGNQVFLYNPS